MAAASPPINNTLLTLLVIDLLMTGQGFCPEEVGKELASRTKGAVNSKRLSRVFEKIRKSRLGKYIQPEQKADFPQKTFYRLHPDASSLDLEDAYALAGKKENFALTRAVKDFPGLDRTLPGFSERIGRLFPPTLGNVTEIASLIESFIQHEVEGWKENLFDNPLKEELEALYRAAEDVPLGVLLPREKVRIWAKERYIRRPLQKEDTRKVSAYIRLVHSFLLIEESRVENLVPKDLYLELLDRVVSLDEVRKEIINRSVKSPIYAALVSDVVYAAVKDTVLLTDRLVKKIPLVSQITGLTQKTAVFACRKSLKKTPEELENLVDEKMLAFIKHHISGLSRESERFFKRTIDEHLLKQLGRELWDIVAENRLSDVTGMIDITQVEDFSPVLLSVWDHFRKTRFFEQALDTGIDRLYERYNDLTVKEILDGLAVDRDKLFERAYSAGSDFLEKRLRLRLEGVGVAKRFLHFYDGLGKLRKKMPEEA